MTAHLTRKLYDERLRTLSEGSVNVNFNAFKDIQWDDPEFAVDTSDPRWVLTSADALGAHPWYREQPLETQIRIGIWRWAVIAKVGMQFEGEDETGDVVLYTITDIGDGKVVVDGNHPWAGERMLFKCTITNVRSAGKEEVEHGHVHGEGGHHH